MSYYKDLREYIKVLEEQDQLVRIKREINKDTELMPLVRWQFRGLPEEERKAHATEIGDVIYYKTLQCTKHAREYMTRGIPVKLARCSHR